MKYNPIVTEIDNLQSFEYKDVVTVYMEMGIPRVVLAVTPPKDPSSLLYYSKVLTYVLKYFPFEFATKG